MTVVQAGSNYVAANPLATLISSGLNSPSCVAIGNSGNMYITEWSANKFLEYNAVTQTLITLASTGLNKPCGVAVDKSGNAYFADAGNNAIKEWNATTHTLTTIVSTGLSDPNAVAVDSSGNVYITDTAHNAVKMWNPTTHAVTTLISSGLNAPGGIAVDSSGNIYLVDWGNAWVNEWKSTTQTLTNLVNSGLYNPWGVAVDNSGNVFIDDRGNNLIKEWSVLAHKVTTIVSSGLSWPADVALDAAGNVYITDGNNNAFKELVEAWVSGRHGQRMGTRGVGSVAAGAAHKRDAGRLLCPHQRPELANPWQSSRRCDSLLLYPEHDRHTRHGPHHGLWYTNTRDPANRDTAGYYQRCQGHLHGGLCRQFRRVTATGNPLPTLSETGALPSGVSFNAATGILSGTPAAGTAGSSSSPSRPAMGWVPLPRNLSL